MIKKLVSVIIPTYNRAHLISEAIESVVNQTYKDLEIIVVDDGSLDNTEKIVRKWQEKDKRIFYIKHEKNRGISAARNTGISYSKGDYLAFLDDDDIWLHQKIEVQMKEMMKSDFDLLFSNLYFWDSKKNTKYKAFELNPLSMGRDVLGILIKKNFGTTSTAFLRKSILKKVGFFDETLPPSEDYDLWLRIVYNGFKIGFIEEPLILYRIHSIQMTKKLYVMRTSRLKVFIKLIVREPLLLIKYPLLIKKILVLGSYKLIYDLLRLLKVKNK